MRQCGRLPRWCPSRIETLEIRHSPGAGGLPLLDKYFYTEDPHLVGGACLGLGIVSARTQTEHDPAYALLYEYVEKARTLLRPCWRPGHRERLWPCLAACTSCSCLRGPAQQWGQAGRGLPHARMVPARTRRS